MRTRDLLLGAMTGFVAGYAAYRCFEAYGELRAPSRPRKKDASAYGRVHRSLALSGIARGIAGAGGIAFGPLGSIADAALAPLPKWLRPAAFVAVLSAAEAALEFPAAFVEDYTIERRYGLTPQDAASWARDYAKSSGLTLGVTAVVATLFGAVVRRAPRTWPLIATIGALPLFVAGNVIVPLYVLPLFNRFEPLTGRLEERLRALASRYGVGDADILRMDMSRQTSKANAFVAGIGSTHRIVIGDTLLENFPDDEVEFVVAHELGHYVAKDTWRTIFLGQGLVAALFLLANAVVGAKERDRLRDRPLLLARLYFWMLVGSQVLRPALFAFMRSREWAADRFASGATGAHTSGASAFRRLRDQNLAEEETPAWHEFLFGSHPSLKARIAALEHSQSPQTDT